MASVGHAAAKGLRRECFCEAYVSWRQRRAVVAHCVVWKGKRLREEGIYLLVQCVVRRMVLVRDCWRGWREVW